CPYCNYEFAFDTTAGAFIPGNAEVVECPHIVYSDKRADEVLQQGDPASPIRDADSHPALSDLNPDLLTEHDILFHMTMRDIDPALNLDGLDGYEILDWEQDLQDEEHGEHEYWSVSVRLVLAADPSRFLAELLERAKGAYSGWSYHPERRDCDLSWGKVQV